MGADDRKRRHSQQPDRIAHHRLDPNRFQSRHVLAEPIIAAAGSERPADESGRLTMKQTPNAQRRTSNAEFRTCSVLLNEVPNSEYQTGKKEKYDLEDRL